LASLAGGPAVNDIDPGIGYRQTVAEVLDKKKHTIDY
jgi:hypothetical protein